MSRSILEIASALPFAPAMTTVAASATSETVVGMDRSDTSFGELVAAAELHSSPNSALPSQFDSIRNGSPGFELAVVDLPNPNAAVARAQAFDVAIDPMVDIARAHDNSLSLFGAPVAGSVLLFAPDEQHRDELQPHHEVQSRLEAEAVIAPDVQGQLSTLLVPLVGSVQTVATPIVTSAKASDEIVESPVGNTLTAPLAAPVIRPGTVGPRTSGEEYAAFEVRATAAVTPDDLKAASSGSEHATPELLQFQLPAKARSTDLAHAAARTSLNDPAAVDDANLVPPRVEGANNPVSQSLQAPTESRVERGRTRTDFAPRAGMPKGAPKPEPLQQIEIDHPRVSADHAADGHRDSEPKRSKKPASALADTATTADRSAPFVASMLIPQASEGSPPRGVDPPPQRVRDVGHTGFTASVPETRETPSPEPLRAVDLTLGKDDERVRVTVTTRSGEMRAQVVANSPELAQRLRSELPDLSRQLDRAGYDSDVRPSGVPAAVSSASHVQTSAEQNDFGDRQQAWQGSGSESQHRGRRQDQQPEPEPDAFDKEMSDQHG